jgi:hypothetical protein
MDLNSKIFIEKHLWEMWCKLGLDKPSNWEEFLIFVAEDIEESSNYLTNGDFHSGDIEIGFRRFFESRSI